MKLRFALVILAAFSLAFAGCGKKDGATGGKAAKTKPSKKGKKSKKSSYAGGEVKDGGTISGTITYTGDKKDGPAKITKDKEVCKDQPQEGALVVVDGKVKNAVVMLQGIKAGKKWSDGPNVVDNTVCRFEPRVSFAKVKSNLTTTNSDDVLHNTHGFLKRGNKDLFNVALTKKGASKNRKLKKAGLVDLKCDAHEWMQAYIWVTSNPYVAISGADGSFELKDVPAGEHTAIIWHEKLGEKEVKVTVTAGGTAKLDHAF
jgi:plastocyanin